MLIQFGVIWTTREKLVLLYVSIKLVKIGIFETESHSISVTVYLYDYFGLQLERHHNKPYEKGNEEGSDPSKAWKNSVLQKKSIMAVL